MRAQWRAGRALAPDLHGVACQSRVGQAALAAWATGAVGVVAVEAKPNRSKRLDQGGRRARALGVVAVPGEVTNGTNSWAAAALSIREALGADTPEVAVASGGVTRPHEVERRRLKHSERRRT